MPKNYWFSRYLSLDISMASVVKFLVDKLYFALRIINSELHSGIVFVNISVDRKK